jgi:D-Tyr-tRNAtyr deacylase
VLRGLDAQVETGDFGARMQESVNDDGAVTILLEAWNHA